MISTPTGGDGGGSGGASDAAAASPSGDESDGDFFTGSGSGGGVFALFGEAGISFGACPTGFLDSLKRGRNGAASGDGSMTAGGAASPPAPSSSS